MPASSQTSPTSGIRSTGSPQPSQRDRRRRRSTGGAAPRAGRAPRRALLELGPRPDHVHVAARAGVERQRQPVVAAARDVPVAHVAAASRPCACPCTRASTRPSRSRRASAGGARATEMNQSSAIRKISGGVAAPAVRVAVLVESGLDEEAALLEVADDLVGGLGGREAVEPAVLVVEAARLVDGREHREALPSCRARSPRRRSPARCGRCPFPPRARPRPRRSRGARRPLRAAASSNGPV